MASATLFRLSGLAGVLSGVLVIISFLLPQGAISGTAGVLSLALGTFLLAGVYLRQREESGGLGAVGYIVNALGLVLTVGVVSTFVYALPSLGKTAQDALLAGPFGQAALVSSLVLLVGCVLFGIATIRAGVWPRLAAALYIVGQVPITITPFLPGIVLSIAAVVLGVSLVWFGYVLWSGEGERVLQPKPAIYDAGRCTMRERRL